VAKKDSLKILDQRIWTADACWPC